MARYLGGLGWSAAGIRAHLQNSPQGYRSQDIANAVRLAVTWRRRITGAINRDGSNTIPREWMTRNRSLSSAFRYAVMFSDIDPATGEEKYFTVVVESSNNLTLDELKNAALAMYAGELDERYRPEGFNPTIASDFRVLTAERRSG